MTTLGENDDVTIYKTILQSSYLGEGYLITGRNFISMF
jgi:hypothetical protein